jgi:hypothetical protein
MAFVGGAFVVVVVASEGVGNSVLTTMVGISSGITRGGSLAEGEDDLASSTTPRVRTMTYAAMS